MKKTQIIELFKNIKTTIVAFISIVLFVALSVGIYAGLSWVSESIYFSVDSSIKQTNLHDLELMYSYGFEKEDIDTLNNIEGVDDIEGQYLSYETFIFNNKKYQATVLQLPKRIDKLLEYEGSLPIKENEIAIDARYASVNNVNIGEKIIIERSISSLSNLNTLLNYDIDSNNIEELKNIEEAYYLNNEEFIVTALVKSPRYMMYDDQHYGINLNNKLANDAFFYVNEKAFNEKAFCGYVDINIINSKINENLYYTNEYKKDLNEFKDEVMLVSQQLVENKYNKIINKVDEITTNFKKQLDEADNEIKINEKKIKDAEKQIKEAEVLLAEGKKKLLDAEDELDSARNEYNYYVSIFNEAKSIYDEANNIVGEIIGEFQNYISDSRSDIEQLAYQYGGEEARNIVSQIIDDILSVPIEDIESYIDSLFIEIEKYIDEFGSELSASNYQLNEAQKQLDDGYLEYNKKQEEYDQAIIDLNNAKRKLAKAKVDYENALIDFDEFVDKTSNIEESSCSGLLRQQIQSYITINVMCNMYNKLRYSMAALFVVVGLLVCYSAISRIVADQTKDIGTKKALGFNQKEITLYYLIYVSITLILGFIFGGILGYYLVEGIFVPVLNDFLTKPIVKYFSIKQMYGICALEAILLLFTTYVACFKTLKKNAIILLKGNNIINGKHRFFEKWKIWDKLSLLSQTIINNCLNDYRRVLGTIVGIAGSTALIVTALTFNNNALGSFDKQFKNSYFFDSIINFDGDETKCQKIVKVLEDNNVTYSKVIKNEMYINCPDDSITTIVVFAYDDLNDFKKLVHLNPFNKTDNSIDEGMWISSAYYNFYKPNQDDIIVLSDMSGNDYETKANGYFENYLVCNYAFMNVDTYHTNLNSNDKINAFLIDSKNIDKTKLLNDLKLEVNIDEIEDFVSESKAAFSVFESLSSVMVLVYMILAVVMSLLVLLNLLSMFVDEKKRELIVLMINGFDLKDARRYIYSDTIVLTIIGIIIGVIVGVYVGNLSIGAFDTNSSMFMRKIDYYAILIGVVGSGVLTFIVSVIALRKIKRFKLTDINKA